MSQTEFQLVIPLDDDSLADLLDKYAGDAFEVMKFLEAYATASGKAINRQAVYAKLLERWQTSEEDKV